ncbi:hypothetical protein [Geodermatophilus ruber]|uniref:FGGY family of carbohydrate kinases, N-terminal domain n=1 Tax=Geodermatophilus ruber TaxID=504800 RepID=A0A1I4AV70_9ACTN|nr:hypothetical protein [Geodermatophilus ruber]SFK60193.1 hypothetical protein SAMN04488085_102410 [Geodermatophilus ruber]
MPVLAMDAGTTRVTALVMGEDGAAPSRGDREFEPDPGRRDDGRRAGGWAS